MKEISEATKLKKSSVTSLINQLKKNRYVNTHKDPNDGRTTLVYLSNKSLKAEKTFQKVENILAKVLLKEISKSELSKTESSLVKIINEFENFLESERQFK
jgi:DNA-binding MarR family transcriptional regulator